MNAKRLVRLIEQREKLGVWGSSGEITSRGSSGKLSN